MKIYLDSKEIYELTDDKLNVLKAYLLEEELESEIERRIIEAIESKYQACLGRVRADWESKLEESGIDMIPTNKENFAKLVFKQDFYKNRTAREAEFKASLKS